MTMDIFTILLTYCRTSLHKTMERQAWNADIEFNGEIHDETYGDNNPGNR